MIRETPIYSKVRRLVLLTLGHRMTNSSSLPFFLSHGSRSRRQKLRYRAQVSTPRTVFLLPHCNITVPFTPLEHIHQNSQANTHSTIFPESKTRCDKQRQWGSRPEGKPGTTLAPFPCVLSNICLGMTIGKFAAIKSYGPHLTS